MAQSPSSRHSAFRASRGSLPMQFRMTMVVAVALLIGIGLGAVSIAPRSGWHAATPAAPTLAHDAWLLRSSARG